MKRIVVLTSCFLAVCFAVFGAQSPKPPDDTPLNRVEKRIRTALPNVEKNLSFEYPKSYPNTLIVNYRTRTFMVHGQSKGGEYSEKPRETVGPSYKGFRLRLSLQDVGAANAAEIPQTIRRPYWRTDLDIRLLKGTTKQMYCGLSYGSGVDQDLLKRVRKAVSDLGTAPYLNREQTAKREPRI